MNILGLSCFYHDSAVCIMRDGEIACAVQEERFTRKKHDSVFPANSIAWCLKRCNLKIDDIDFLVFYEKPFIKFERILETYLAYAPLGFRQFIQAVPSWLKQKLWIPEYIRKNLGYKGKILFCEHHQAHAASAFYPSPFREAAFLTIDGVGEWDTASFGIGSDKGIEIIDTLKFPHSLGLFYSAFTYYTGFKVNSGEYKMMGLAPYGEPKYTKLILDKLLDLKEDGSFRLNMKYFSYCYGLKMINTCFDKLFSAPARKPESEITQKYMDVAASAQKVTEEIMLRMSRHAYKVTGKDKLCLAGGVALNCVSNSRILKETPFKEIWVQPASGDAGGALGAALLIWFRHLGNTRSCDDKNDRQKASLLGPSYTDDYIESYLNRENITYKKLLYQDIADTVSELICQGKIIGWFQGSLEFGPRALGARSIVADARNAEMQSRLNLKIKFRESFRPFAAAILSEKITEWFDFDRDSPYMLFVAPVIKGKRLDPGNEEKFRGLEKLRLKRSLIPAVTHVDYSSRIQTVKRQDNPLYYDMIDSFYKKTGCPVIINTSFNVRGEPLVCSPEDAFSTFMNTDIDYLSMGCFLIDKKEQPQKNNYLNRNLKLVLD